MIIRISIFVFLMLILCLSGSKDNKPDTTSEAFSLVSSGVFDDELLTVDYTIYALSAILNFVNASEEVDMQAFRETIDAKGNVYAVSDALMVFDGAGVLIDSIEIPGTFTNMGFGGEESNTLYPYTINYINYC